MDRTIRPSGVNRVMSHLRSFPTCSMAVRAAVLRRSDSSVTPRKLPWSMDWSVVIREVMMFCMSALFRRYTKYTLNAAIATSVRMRETYSTTLIRVRK